MRAHMEVGRRSSFIISARGFPTYRTGAFSTQQPEDLRCSFLASFLTIKCMYTGTPGVPPLSNKVKRGQKQNNCFISVFRGGQTPSPIASTCTMYSILYV